MRWVFGPELTDEDKRIGWTHHHEHCLSIANICAVLDSHITAEDVDIVLAGLRDVIAIRSKQKPGEDSGPLNPYGV